MGSEMCIRDRDEVQPEGATPDVQRYLGNGPSAAQTAPNRRQPEAVLAKHAGADMDAGPDA